MPFGARFFYCAIRGEWQGKGMKMLNVRRIETQNELEAVRELCRAYRLVLAERIPDRPEILANYYAEADYEALLADLPQKHARPDGAIFAAILNGVVVGCGMTHRIDYHTCEIKRVFIAPQARGHGAAQAIFIAAMEQARADGYRVMVLDTMVRLHEAISLYKKLGFTDWDPFYELPQGFEDLIRFYGIHL